MTSATARAAPVVDRGRESAAALDLAVAVHRIVQALVHRVGVDSGHEPVLYDEFVVEQRGYRGQAVGSA